MLTDEQTQFAQITGVLHPRVADVRVARVALLLASRGWLSGGELEDIAGATHLSSALVRYPSLSNKAGRLPALRLRKPAIISFFKNLVCGSPALGPVCPQVRRHKQPSQDDHCDPPEHDPAASTFISSRADRCHRQQ